MTISLSSEQEKWIEQKVSSGKYSSASEVIDEALQLLEKRDQFRKKEFEELREKIQVGIDQLENGQYTVIEDDELDEYFESIKAKGRKKLEEKVEQKT